MSAYYTAQRVIDESAHPVAADWLYLVLSNVLCASVLAAVRLNLDPLDNALQNWALFLTVALLLQTFDKTRVRVHIAKAAVRITALFR